jgi:hypothetical protein
MSAGKNPAKHLNDFGFPPRHSKFVIGGPITHGIARNHAPNDRERQPFRGRRGRIVD